MTGRSNIQGEPCLWADSSLELIEVGYEVLTIRIREETGIGKLIRCRGYIGFQMVGVWDEVIIETATIHSRHSFIEDCERRLNSLPETGAKTRERTGNKLLDVTLIDGCSLWICAHEFYCEES